MINWKGQVTIVASGSIASLATIESPCGTRRKRNGHRDSYNAVGGLHLPGVYRAFG
jgi:hypothetical protein